MPSPALPSLQPSLVPARSDVLMLRPACLHHCDCSHTVLPHLGLLVPAGLAAAGDGSVHDVVRHQEERLQLCTQNTHIHGCRIF